MKAHWKLDKKHLIKSLVAIIGAVIVLSVLIVMPQQKQVSDRLGGTIHEPAEAKVYQLRGLYNVVKDHKYRVDYFNIEGKKLSSKYFDNKDQISPHDWGNSIRSKWTFGE